MAEVDPESELPDEVISELDSELRVVIDKWSTGNLGWSDLLVATGIAFAAVALAYLARRVLRRATREWEGPAAAGATVIGQLVSVGVYLFAAAVILEVLGFSVGPVLVLVLLFAAIFLVLRPIVQNLGSGLALQLRGSLQRGDVVEIDSVVGVVEEVSTRAVVLMTEAGETVYIPNSQVIDQRLTNLSKLGRRQSSLVVRVPGAMNMAHFVSAATGALSELDGVLPTPPPILTITGFEGTQVLVTARFWHEPGIEAAFSAVDAVGHTMLEVVGVPGLTLADSAVVVHQPDPVMFPTIPPKEERQ